MNAKSCIKKKKDFGKSLLLLTTEVPEAYSSDSSNYDRILRWYIRTSKYLKEYLLHNHLNADLTHENAKIFLHQLLVIYFFAYENSFIRNSNAEYFESEYPNFLTNCLKIHIPINKKGHHLKRTILSQDMSSFFYLFLEIPDTLLTEEYRMTETHKQQISKLAVKEIPPENKFLDLIKIFFDEK